MTTDFPTWTKAEYDDRVQKIQILGAKLKANRRHEEEGLLISEWMNKLQIAKNKYGDLNVKFHTRKYDKPYDRYYDNAIGVREIIQPPTAKNGHILVINIEVEKEGSEQCDSDYDSDTDG